MLVDVAPVPLELSLATKAATAAGTVGFFMFLGGTYYVYRHCGLLSLVSETGTSTVGAIDAEGVVELEGAVEAVDVLDTTISDADDAVLSAWRIEEYDAAGRNAGWQTEGLGVDSVAFALADGTGSVTVDPPKRSTRDAGVGGTILSWGGEGVYLDDCRAAFRKVPTHHHVGPDEELPDHLHDFIQDHRVTYSSAPLTDTDSSPKNGERRYHEGTVDAGEEVYLLGYARALPDATRPLGPEDVVVGAHPDGDVPFIVSTVGEDRLVERTRRNVKTASAAALVGIVAVVGVLAWAVT